MTNIRQEFKGNIGLFLVCAELSRLNLVTMPTTRNTRGYDIVVMDPKTGGSTGIQVKCTDRKNYPLMSSYFADYEQKIREKVACPFIFVDISDWPKPRYFILSEEEMKRLLKEMICNYAHLLMKKHGQSWEELLQDEKDKKRRRHLWASKLDKLEGYEKHWKTITDRLKGNRNGEAGARDANERV